MSREERTLEGATVLVDESRQAGTEHNRNAFGKSLHEDGWPDVVVRAVSEFTVFIHTRTLNADRREKFQEYANEQGWTQLEDDMVGEIYRVDI